MKNKIEKYIGNKNVFAIRYQPIANEKNYAFCHLVLGGEIIGNVNEPCYLSVWKSSIKNIKVKLENDTESLFDDEFNNRTDREIFELIWKANEAKEEHKTEFKYLPVLDNKIWSNCGFSIDETTDAYLITMTKNKDEIKFIWEGWREPCSIDKIGKLYSVSLEKKLVLETLEKCLIEIENNT
ncbi:Imm42 family immunity protein [Flavobacterium limi]|uniref:Uncharacterized protein n=1 Tax=Flavobacterium limi TaxID=2045105 RepID=A0ABQ1UB74_9FLAO|nr:Imm42 family immunity protein [Flavobacterium limi]GGF13849.1 hypothetical protein GCM10011518_23820 [Flavobacterium limi]